MFFFISMSTRYALHPSAVTGSEFVGLLVTCVVMRLVFNYLIVLIVWWYERINLNDFTAQTKKSL